MRFSMTALLAGASVTGRDRALTEVPSTSDKVTLYPVRMDDLERMIDQKRREIVLADGDRAKLDIERDGERKGIEEYVKTEQDRFDTYIESLIKDLDNKFGPLYAANTERKERLQREMRERQDLLVEKLKHCGIKAEVVG